MNVSRKMALAVLAAVPVAAWFALQSPGSDKTPHAAAAPVADPRKGTGQGVERPRTERSPAAASRLSGRNGEVRNDRSGPTARKVVRDDRDRAAPFPSTKSVRRSGKTAARSAGWAAPDPYPQAAVWVESSDLSDLTTSQQEEIQKAAEELVDEIVRSDPDPSSMIYQQSWADAVTASDRLFRQRYGARAWSRHHIEAHHLARTSGLE